MGPCPVKEAGQATVSPTEAQLTPPCPCPDFFTVLHCLLHQLLQPPPVPKPRRARWSKPQAGLLHPRQRARGLCQRQWGPGLSVPAQPPVGPPQPRGARPPQARQCPRCGGEGFCHHCCTEAVGTGWVAWLRPLVCLPGRGPQLGDQQGGGARAHWRWRVPGKDTHAHPPVL